ncbi:hypothetical protein BaRGS_00008126, partial [Batillaria attramentaria]
PASTENLPLSSARLTSKVGGELEDNVVQQPFKPTSSISRVKTRVACVQQREAMPEQLLDTIEWPFLRGRDVDATSHKQVGDKFHTSSQRLLAHGEIRQKCLQ